MNDLRFVADLVVTLRREGIDTWIFGGWAEELHGLSRPREHRDVDLLYRGDDWRRVDAFLAGVDEVVGKRFPHKRAFMADGVLVELFLVQRDRDGWFTLFPAREFRWPDDLFRETGALPVADLASVVAYRRDHDQLKASQAA